jgi:hypothetical protein
MGIAIQFVFSGTGNWTWNFTGSKCKPIGLAEAPLPAVGSLSPTTSKIYKLFVGVAFSTKP